MSCEKINHVKLNEIPAILIHEIAKSNRQFNYVYNYEIAIQIRKSIMFPCISEQLESLKEDSSLQGR